MHRPSRIRPPRSVVTALSLLPGERTLAWATDALGQWYVGTNLALHLPAASGEYRRVGWEDVQRADWDQDSERLTIVEVADWGEPEPSSSFEVAEPGRLLELIRERVTSTVVCNVYARVRGREGVSVVGRRSPSRNAPVRWSYVLSATLDPADPVVAEVAAQTLAEARREVEGL
ncbi:MAG: hypothetical protein ACR2JU_01920 [Nocardioidaceae bacterium]